MCFIDLIKQGNKLGGKANRVTSLFLYSQIISYDSSRGGVSVVTEKGYSTTSFLLVQQAKPTDSGKYTCNPSNAQPKSITVHVLNGEWHRACSPSLSPPPYANRAFLSSPRTLHGRDGGIRQFAKNSGLQAHLGSRYTWN
jgi:hypothetical protein